MTSPTHGNGSDPQKILTSTPYVSPQSSSVTRPESTIFDQVYGGYRRRPAMISLNVQWMPVSGRSGTYQWSGNETGNRKVKTVTFFGTGEMRGQQSAKVTTPPGSDYTDAYLSAFSSKPIPTRHIHQLNTSIFANSTPIPLKPTSQPLFTSNATKTSQTRFSSSNENIQQSKSFDTTELSSSTRSSTYSSSFIPERSAPYEPFSSTQYSSPQSQTFTSSYSTLLRSPTSPITTTLSPLVDSQRCFSTIQTRSQPSPSTFPTVYRSDTSYENLFKPMPPYSVQSYPPSDACTRSFSSSSTESTYKPYVPFPSPALSSSSSYNTEQSSTNERLVLPTPKIEKQIDRPETLLFQHDEDIRPSAIEKPSPFYSPSPESPLNREELQTEELPSISSEPIQILENTLSKYDSLINQISEVLASVSPLSSTVSSMSPGKSVLDYELSSDGSPLLSRKHIESQQPSTVKSGGNTQRPKSSYLIRGDSYDKIVTAISDLDNEIISPSDIQPLTTAINEEKEDVDSPSLDESVIPAVVSEEELAQSSVSLLSNDQTKAQTEQDTDDIKTPLIPEEETKTVPVPEQPDASTTEEEEIQPTFSEEQPLTSTSSVDQQQSHEKIEEENEQTTSSIVEKAAVSTNESQTPSLSNDEELRNSSIDGQQIASRAEEETAIVAQIDEQKIEDGTKTLTTDQAQNQVVTGEEHREEATVLSAAERQFPLENETEKLNTERIASEEDSISSTTEQEPEETINQFLDASRSTPAVEEEPKFVLPQEQPTTAKIEESEVSVTARPLDDPTSEVSQSTEISIDDQQSTVETDTKTVEYIQEQTGLLTNVPADEPVTEETESNSASTASSRKAGKHVTWDEAVVDNEDDEKSASESPPASPADENNKPTLTDEEQVTSDEQQIISSDTTDQEIEPSSPLQTSLSLSDASDQLTSVSEISLTDRQTHSASPIDSSKDETLAVDEASRTRSEVLTYNNSEESNEELESKTIPKDQISSEQQETEMSSKVEEDTSHGSETSPIDNVLPTLQLTIVSPIETLSDTIANRYTSSDVYHGYLGEHNQFVRHEADTDDDATTQSLLASLRQTITAPVTPIIEAIQNVVSNLGTSSDTHSLRTESEVFDRSEDGEILDTTVVQKSKEEASEENQSTLDSSKELKTVFESLREAAIVPITAITETIQTAVSNLQSEKDESASASTSEQLTSSLNEKSNDDLNKEVEETRPSLFGTIQEKVSNAITTLTDAVQNAVSSNVSSTDAETEDKLTTSQEKVHSQPTEQSTSADVLRYETIGENTQSYDSSLTDTSLATEQTSNSEEKRDTTLLSEVPEPSSSVPTEHIDSINTQEPEPQELSDASQIDRKIEESVVSSETQELNKNVLTAINIPTEPVPIETPQETIENSVATSEKSNETTADQKSDQSSLEETKTTFEVIRNAITHPLTTITETIQSIIPTSSSEATEQTVSDAATPMSDAPKETEQIGSTEEKTTLETIRDVITHPLAAISEKIQSVISTSNAEHVEPGPSDARESSTDLSEQVKLSETQSASEWTEVDTTDSGKSQSTESKTTFETIRDALSHPVTTITEKLQSMISPSSNEDVDDAIPNQQPASADTSSTEGSHETGDDKQSKQHTVKSSAQDLASGSEHQNIHEIVNDLISDTISTVISQLKSTSVENEQMILENFSSSSSVTSPITVLNVDDRSESSQSTINEESVPDHETVLSNMTWTDLVGEKPSDEKPDPSLEDVLQSSDHTTHTSTVSEVEQLATTDPHEPSPPLIEDDSLELIHALQGHSIIVPSSPNQFTSAIEKSDKQGPEVSSSSTTTSSQVTSSDRYVSYAIHEMGDSSQERLPALPLAADIPVYQFVKTASDENKEREIPSELSANVNQNQTKDDDLTELDATENLTSFSDDVLIQKLHTSAPKRRENLDASSTDEDVDDNLNDLDQQETSNLHRTVNDLTHQNDASVEGYDQTYQRYDLSSNSSTSTKPTTDDIYIIPGYPGLWRPSADDDDSSHSPLANDADDEDEKRPSESTIKTRTIVRTTDPVHLQSILQQQQHSEIKSEDTALRPESVDVFNRPLNEFPFDVSESDSFKTCASTINSSSVSKQQQSSQVVDSPISKEDEEEHQNSPDEKIFLIRERERGVSLPVTMKIDYDDMALRLSSSTPTDVPLYLSTEQDLPSPSQHNEPMQKTTSSSRASTPSLSSNEGEQQKPPSWLNTVTTSTTTTEGPDGPLEARTTIHKSAKGPISVAECDAQGKFILIENTSRSKSLALAGWKLRQENDSGDILTFTFPDNCLLRPNQSFKVLTRPNESERRNSDLIASSLSSWHTGSNVVTTLINADGKDRSSLTKKTLFS